MPAPEQPIPSIHLEKGNLLVDVSGKRLKVPVYADVNTTVYLFKAELVKAGFEALEIAILAEPVKAFYMENRLELIGLSPTDEAQEDWGRFAEYVMSRRQFTCIRQGEELMVYQDGYWREDGKTFVKADLVQVLAKVKRGFADDVIFNVNARCYRERNEFNKYPDLLNMNNGILNMQTGEFVEHSPTYLFTQKMAVNYKPDAIPRVFLKVLREILPDADDRYTVLEEMAYCLWRALPIQKAFMWVGTGSNGKSTLAAVMDALLGEDNVSHTSIHEIIGDRFAGADVVTKLANIGTDISSKEITNTGLMKRLLGGDRIRVQRKNKAPFDAHSICKMFFFANQLPEVDDNTDAWMRRWIITEFKQQFVGDKADKTTVRQLTRPEELSGVLNLLIRILKGLMARGSFRTEPTIQETRALWGEKADIIQAFIAQKLVIEPKAKETKKAVYDAYVEFCTDRKFSVKHMTPFGQALKEKIRGLEEMVTNIAGRGSPSAKFWSGIRLKGAKLGGFESPDKTDLPPNSKPPEPAPLINEPQQPEPKNVEDGVEVWKCSVCGKTNKEAVITKTPAGDFCSEHNTGAKRQVDSS